MDDAIERYRQALEGEGEAAEQAGEIAARDRLLRLADSTDEMTPAERTWASEASDQDLRDFARSIREGCAP